MQNTRQPSVKSCGVPLETHSVQWVREETKRSIDHKKLHFHPVTDFQITITVPVFLSCSGAPIRSADPKPCQQHHQKYTKLRMSPKKEKFGEKSVTSRRSTESDWLRAEIQTEILLLVKSAGDRFLQACGCCGKFCFPLPCQVVTRCSRRCSRQTSEIQIVVKRTAEAHVRSSQLHF